MAYIFKKKGIIVPTAEHLRLTQADETSSTYLIALDVENKTSFVRYSVQNSINRIEYENDGKIYCYFFKDALQKANEYFNTDCITEGWYLTDFNLKTVEKYDDDLLISDEQWETYGIYAPTLFCLLTKDYYPLRSNLVKLFTKQKYCENELRVVPILQRRVITQNGTYIPDSGYCGIGTAIVSIPEREISLQEKTAVKNGVVTADDDYDGLSKVTVQVQSSEAIDLSKIVEVESIENPTEDDPIIVKYDGQLYLLVKEV